MVAIIQSASNEFDAERARIELEAQAMNHAAKAYHEGVPGYKTILQTPTGQKVFFFPSVGCPKEKHAFSQPIMCCNHVVQQDEIHPVGIVLMPSGYYLCKTCLRLYEHKHQKLFKELVVQCFFCIKDSIITVMQKDPKLFTDLAGSDA